MSDPSRSRTQKKGEDSSKKRRPVSPSPEKDAFNHHQSASKAAKKESGRTPTAPAKKTSQGAYSSFRPASEFVVPEPKRTAPTAPAAPAPKVAKLPPPSKAPLTSSSPPSSSGPGAKAPLPQAIAALQPPTSSQDPGLAPRVPGAPVLTPQGAPAPLHPASSQVPSAPGLAPHGAPAPLPLTYSQVPGALVLPPQGAPAPFPLTYSQVPGAPVLPPQGVPAPLHTTSSQGAPAPLPVDPNGGSSQGRWGDGFSADWTPAQGTPTLGSLQPSGAALRSSPDYPYSPDHALTIQDRTYRIFLKSSRTGIAPRRDGRVN